MSKEAAQGIAIRDICIQAETDFTTDLDALASQNPSLVPLVEQIASRSARIQANPEYLPNTIRFNMMSTSEGPEPIPTLVFNPTAIQEHNFSQIVVGFLAYVYNSARPETMTFVPDSKPAIARQLTRPVQASD